MSNIIKLSKPIKHGDKEISELELRDCTFTEVRKFGLYASEDAKGAMGIDFDVLGKYIETLAALPPSVINQMELKDIMACGAVVAKFFQGVGAQG